MMLFMLRKSIQLFILTILIFVLNGAQNGDHIIPVTQQVSDHESGEQISSDNDLTTFIIDLIQPTCDAPAGIYVKDKFQLKVTQQPIDQPGFVSALEGTVTQFSNAIEHGSIGLLAHNFLSGSEFYEIDLRDKIELIYGDGRTKKYVVSEIRQYQALEPASPYSSFVNLADPSQTLSYSELFNSIYDAQDRLVLQTCISYQDSSSWGRYFVIAVPVN